MNDVGAASSGPGRRPRWKQLKYLPAATAILLVRCYQLLLSPLLGRTCRFHPSCSQYYIAAVTKYGLLSGTWRGIGRILRCHPWNPGGYDPP
ncbi:MAG: membrane protein insertion efficiency factor YidD [Planctomycetaceae bacterium]|nr:membrane protein insertion efficiency factor YidD [Planctomycetaceae bacterium]